MARDTETGFAGWNAGRGQDGRGHRAQAERRRRIGMLVALLVVCVACAVCAWPPKSRISRGLWLKGGTAVSMSAQTAGGEAIGSEQLSQAAATIGKRLRICGVSESRVSTRGSDGLVVDLPRNVDAESIARTVGGVGDVGFARMDEIGDADALSKINAGTADVPLAAGTYKTFIGDDQIESVSVTEVSSAVYAVTFMLNDEARRSFADVTEELAEDMGRIAVVVDGRVISAPSVSEKIDGGQVSISGDFSREEANAIKALVDTERLPVGFSVTGTEKVGPLVGKALMWAMVAAVAVGFVAVSAFGFARLKKLALVVAGSYAVYVCTVLGAMALFSRLDMFILTLPGVAGGVWAGAVAVFTAWLIARRFQQMVLEGTSVRGAASTAVEQGTVPVRLPVALAFVLSSVFLLLPFPGLGDLGTMVIMGTVCGLASVFWFAATLLRLLAMGTIQGDPESWGVAER